MRRRAENKSGRRDPLAAERPREPEELPRGSLPSFSDSLDDEERTLPGCRRGTRVLLAEDDDDMRAVLSVVLEEDGHEVTRVANGTELLRALRLDEGPLQEVPFDLVLTDLRMPKWTGAEVVERLRAAGSEVPVIIITAFPDEAARRVVDQCEALLVAKPFRSEALRMAVDVMLDLGGASSRAQYVSSPDAAG